MVSRKLLLLAGLGICGTLASDVETSKATGQSGAAFTGKPASVVKKRLLVVSGGNNKSAPGVEKPLSVAPGKTLVTGNAGAAGGKPTALAGGKPTSPAGDKTSTLGSKSGSVSRVKKPTAGTESDADDESEESTGINTGVAKRRSRRVVESKGQVIESNERVVESKEQVIGSVEVPAPVDSAIASQAGAEPTGGVTVKAQIDAKKSRKPIPAGPRAVRAGPRDVRDGPRAVRAGRSSDLVEEDLSDISDPDASDKDGRKSVARVSGKKSSEPVKPSSGIAKPASKVEKPSSEIAGPASKVEDSASDSGEDSVHSGRSAFASIDSKTMKPQAKVGGNSNAGAITGTREQLEKLSELLSRGTAALHGQAHAKAMQQRHERRAARDQKRTALSTVVDGLVDFPDEIDDLMESFGSEAGADEARDAFMRSVRGEFNRLSRTVKYFTSVLGDREGFTAQVRNRLLQWNDALKTDVSADLSWAGIADKQGKTANHEQWESILVPVCRDLLASRDALQQQGISLHPQMLKGVYAVLVTDILKRFDPSERESMDELHALKVPESVLSEILQTVDLQSIPDAEHSGAKLFVQSHTQMRIQDLPAEIMKFAQAEGYVPLDASAGEIRAVLASLKAKKSSTTEKRGGRSSLAEVQSRPHLLDEQTLHLEQRAQVLEWAHDNAGRQQAMPKLESPEARIDFDNAFYGLVSTNPELMPTDAVTFYLAHRLLVVSHPSYWSSDKSEDWFGVLVRFKPQLSLRADIPDFTNPEPRVTRAIQRFTEFWHLVATAKQAIWDHKYTKESPAPAFSADVTAAHIALACDSLEANPPNDKARASLYQQFLAKNNSAATTEVSL